MTTSKEAEGRILMSFYANLDRVIRNDDQMLFENCIPQNLVRHYVVMGAAMLAEAIEDETLSRLFIRGLYKIGRK